MVETTKIKERFAAYLRKLRKRCTAERFAIMEMVIELPGHFTAEEVGEHMRNDGFPVSTATVYATLELLVGFGLLVKQRFSDRAWIYELARGEKNNDAEVHHHLICTECGKVKEIRDAELSRMIERKRFGTFTRSYYTLYIYGTCGRCRKRIKTK